MTTDDIIRSLKTCGTRVGNCNGCALNFKNEAPGCFDKLKLLAAKELEILRAENGYLREGNENETSERND